MNTMHGPPQRATVLRAGLRAGALVLAAASSVSSVGAQDPESPMSHRPERYSPAWGQFILDTYTNPRQVSVFRLGAGEARPAEYWVFEWVDGGQRLRPLHRSVLRNDWMPWTWRAEGDGRFLVTFDDRFSPEGSTDNCIVLYDFVRGVTVAKRAEDFLPEQQGENEDAFWKWNTEPVLVDPLLQRIYPTSVARASKGGAPFLVVDLPSLTVRAEPAPESLPERVYRETANGHAWEWEFSMGGGGEPDWLVPQALPLLLQAKQVQPLDDARPFGPREDTVVFRLEADTGEYVRCASSEWQDPPNRW